MESKLEPSEDFAGAPGTLPSATQEVELCIPFTLEPARAGAVKQEPGKDADKRKESQEAGKRVSGKASQFLQSSLLSRHRRLSDW